MIRQPGPWREAADTIGMAELDLFDWMDRAGVEPGDDMSRYFAGE